MKTTEQNGARALFEEINEMLRRVPYMIGHAKSIAVRDSNFPFDDIEYPLVCALRNVQDAASAVKRTIDD